MQWFRPCWISAQVFVLVFVCRSFAPGTVAAQGNPPSPPSLYFLAATFSEAGFPITLYRPGSAQTLVRVRTIERHGDDAYAIVTQSDNAIYVIHPYVTATGVTVIHTANPLQVDNVKLNRRGRGAVDSMVFAATNRSGADELPVPLVGDATKGSPLPTDDRPELWGVIFDPLGSHAQPASWEDYRRFTYLGMPGGPVLTPVIPGEVKSGTLYLSAYGHNIPLATVPGDIADLNKHGMVFIASNREYLLCYRTVTMEEYQRRDVPNPATIYTFDRAANRWTTFTVEGNASNGKLFGAWLGLRVGIDNWDRKVSPGREAERSTDSALLPSVRRLYEANIAAIDRVTTPSYRVPGQYLPGILILRNLSDGRVIRIVTEHEDSEILFADDHAVIYRVDDSIYQAPIDGNQLGKSTVVAHGDDVPEIHWSFWGKGDTN